jgi:alpha-L-rhamnosidase
MKRRDFIKSSAITGSTLALGRKPAGSRRTTSPSPFEPVASLPAAKRALPDLKPARWIWYPSGRCLPNTFVLFRREVVLDAKPLRAKGWIAADSRYRLEVNGRRVQWGPAPADPRWPEADPLDLTEFLQPGRNVIGATVLFYGHGDGTWPLGKPGFLFWLETETGGGSAIKTVSDASWKAHLARAWRPGQPKRWYLRALQEEFDARLYPDGWTMPDFREDSQWVNAMELEGSPNKPALSTDYHEYVNDLLEGPAEAELRARSIPLLSETLVPVARLAESFWVDWRRAPQEYFEFRPPDAFEAVRRSSAVEIRTGQWEISLDGKRGAALTFELEEQVVGWPYFTIDAPAGTTVELLVHEAHAEDGPPLLNTHFDTRGPLHLPRGREPFEGFDYESCAGSSSISTEPRGRVTVRDVGVRRRIYPWPNEPDVRVEEPPSSA